MTMAALLHKDANGAPLLPELIKRSGLGTTEWLQKYLDCYLSPLLHCFYYHDMAFMPHGENIFLVLKDYIPVKAYIKDLTEETVIFNELLVLPEKVKRIQLTEEDDIRIQSLLADVFDCFFRFLSAILDESNFPETQFWGLVAECISDYQKRFPELKDKFSRFDLFVPEFLCCCLNRLQLKNNLQMLDLTDPSKSFQMVGLLKNPIAHLKPRRVVKGNSFYKMETV